MKVPEFKSKIIIACRSVASYIVQDHHRYNLFIAAIYPTYYPTQAAVLRVVNNVGACLVLIIYSHVD